jgi:tRNA dimethylallyltransferase
VPIVVGGTSYWIEHLILPDRLVSKSPPASPPGSPLLSGASLPQPSPALATALASLPPELADLFHNLPEQAPSATADPDTALLLHQLLAALDPPVAQRWHWHDTRKVLRNLVIIRESGRTVSAVLAEQSASVPKPRFVAAARGRRLSAGARG